MDLLDLADFCEWVMKASPCFFMTGDEFVSLLNTNRKRVALEIVEGNPIVTFLQKRLEFSRVYKATPSLMLEELKKEHPDQKGLPKSPSSLGKEIRRLMSDLEAIGIKTNTMKTKRGVELIFERMKEEKNEPPFWGAEGERKNLPSPSKARCRAENNKR